MAARSVIVTCAVTGSIHTPSQSPHLPLTPAQIIEESVAAAQAGAAVLHLHARNPADGSPTADPEVFMQFLPQIRARCDAIINITTGGGPGIMEAANLGAHEAGGDSIGLNIVLPHEQFPNPYVSPQFCFQFHYFAIRKMHFLLRARALVVFPGGWGTLDELFETLTLVQTEKIKAMPILIFGREFWEGMLNFDYMVEQGVISPEDLALFSYVETAEEAWEAIRDFLKDEV